MCVTEHDWTTSTASRSRPLTREDEVVISTSDQLNLITARHLLKAASDLALSSSTTDSETVKGKLGRCVVSGGLWRECRVWRPSWSGSNTLWLLTDTTGINPSTPQ